MASLGLAVIDGLRSIYIVYRCKINANYSDVIFEVTMFVIIDVLQTIAFVVFIVYYCFCKFREANTSSGGSCSNCATCIIIGIACILFFLMCVLTFAAPTVGLYRDIDDIEMCKNESQTLTHEDNLKIVWLNMATKLIVHVATSIERLFVVILISISICKWVWVPLRPDELLNVDTNDVSSKVNERFYLHQRKYIKVGNGTKVRREIFEAWFVVQYCVYLLSLLVEIIHLVKPLYHDIKIDRLDLIHSALCLLFDLLAFIIPFYMGIWLNYSHHNYHKKMLEACFEMEIGTGDERFYPGCDHENTDRNDTVHYMKYYNLMSSKNLAKRADFDFVPSIFGVTIPLDSQGYTFTILSVIKPSILFIIITMVKVNNTVNG